MRPAAAKLRAWRNEPVRFVRECLKAEPDDWQAEVLLAYGGDPVVNPLNLQRLALKASKGPGKSTILAWIGWHFLSCYPYPKAAATSISGDNLRDNLWAELAKWQNNSAFLKEAFSWNAERIAAKGHEETWWLSARNWPKQADATQQANTLAGLHADFVLILVDESGGIPSGVVAAAEGALANAEPGSGRVAKLALAGNPTHLSGPLYEACTRKRKLYWVKEISGDPHDPLRAPRVSKQWAQEQIDQYGADNPWVLVNVFGRFPPGQSNALMAVEEVGDAAKRVIHPSTYDHEARILGVDVARFGDDRSVLFPRQGRAAFRPKTFRNLKTTELADQVALAIMKWKPHAVFIDVTGVGAGVVDRLDQLGHSVLGIEFGSSALRNEPGKPVANNRRTEMWLDMAEWIRGGGCIPDDPELLSELPAPTYYFDSKGRQCLEPKDLLKKRGLVSPDKADALALTFAAPVVVPTAIEAFEQKYGTSQHGDYDPYAERA